MEQPSPYGSRLRFLDAEALDDSVVNFDGLDVIGPGDEKLGDVDGFVVDTESGRVLYAVIDSGGWFTSRRFLLPIGHAAVVDREAGALRADVSREALQRYPQFNEQEFRDFSDDDLGSFDRNTGEACCPDDESVPGPTPAQTLFESRAHYRQPDWWSARGYAPDRLRPVATESYRSRAAASAGELATERAIVQDNPGAEGLGDLLARIESAPPAPGER
jgi:PRC-barrel domain protein